MEIKELVLVKDGKRNVKVCNSVRSQMFAKIKEILEDNDFAVEVAANGELAIATATDAETGNTYYTRLAISFTNKALDSKIVKKPKEKVEDVELPTLFD